jgi:hypothetical protein
MPTNKDNQKTGSKGSMSSSSPDREFENQGKNPSSGKGQQASGFGKETGSHRKPDDDEMNTAGGREGQFSDKKRGSDAQWSPGSSRSTDE